MHTISNAPHMYDIKVPWDKQCTAKNLGEKRPV